MAMRTPSRPTSRQARKNLDATYLRIIMFPCFGDHRIIAPHQWTRQLDQKDTSRTHVRLEMFDPEKLPAIYTEPAQKYLSCRRFSMTKKINAIFNLIFIAIWISILFIMSISSSTNFGGYIEMIFKILSFLMVITAPFSLFSYILTKAYPFLISDSIYRKILKRNPILFFIWREVLDKYSDDA